MSEPQRSTKFQMWRSPLAVGPVLFTVVFLIRSFTPMFDPLVFSIAAALAVVVAFMMTGQRWAGLAFYIFPVALFTSPAGREFSFNLSAVDNRLWRWHALVGLISLGIGCVAAGFVTIGHAPKRWPLTTGFAAGVGLGGLMIGAIGALFSHPGYGQTISTATRESLPVIEMLNYGYDVPELQLTENTAFAAVVQNSSNLPHTITIDSLDIDLYVPAGRSSVLELSPEQLTKGANAFPMYCTVGDHATLGMRRSIEFVRLSK
jgi:hypothetical protein